MADKKWLLALTVMSTGLLFLAGRQGGKRLFNRWFSTAAATQSAEATKSVVVEGKNDIEKSLPPDIEEIHRCAVLEGKDTYEDPKTGFTVFTRLAHLKKEQCCGCRCRHCPYGHVNVGRKPSQVGRVVKRDKTAATASGGAAPHSNVYTKGGDKGTSSLFNGERRKKTDAVFEALGAVDELSSQLGLTRAMLRDTRDKKHNELMNYIESIQQELLNVGTVVATPTPDPEEEVVKEIIDRYQFGEKTMEMEQYIDKMDSTLVPLRIFILPGEGTLPRHSFMCVGQPAVELNDG